MDQNQFGNRARSTCQLDEPEAGFELGLQRSSGKGSGDGNSVIHRLDFLFRSSVTPHSWVLSRLISLATRRMSLMVHESRDRGLNSFDLARSPFSSCFMAKSHS